VGIFCGSRNGSIWGSKTPRYCHASGFRGLVDKTIKCSMHNQMKENPALRYSVHGWSPGGEPPVQPHGRRVGKGSPRVLPHADHCHGVARPPIPVVGRVMRLVPQRWQLPQDRPQYILGGGGWHGPDSSTQVEDVGLPARLTGGVAGANAPSSPSPAQPSNAGPPNAGGTPGPWRQAHGHPTDTLPLGSRPGKVERRRDVLRFHPTEPRVGASDTRSTAKPRPFSMPPPPRHVGNS